MHALSYRVCLFQARSIRPCSSMSPEGGPSDSRSPTLVTPPAAVFCLTPGPVFMQPVQTYVQTVWQILVCMYINCVCLISEQQIDIRIQQQSVTTVACGVARRSRYAGSGRSHTFKLTSDHVPAGRFLFPSFFSGGGGAAFDCCWQQRGKTHLSPLQHTIIIIAERATSRKIRMVPILLGNWDRVWQPKMYYVTCRTYIPDHFHNNSSKEIGAIRANLQRR